MKTNDESRVNEIYKILSNEIVLRQFDISKEFFHPRV